MRTNRRMVLTASLALACAAIAACDAVPNAHLVSLSSSEGSRVKAALSRWPVPTPGTPLRRPFYVTLHAAGKRVTATGILEYYGPRDFRITATSDQHVTVLDARMNWAGVSVIQSPPGVSRHTVASMVQDLAHGFEIPHKLDGLKAGDEKMVLQRHGGDTHQYTWIFDRQSGRLLESNIDISPLDSLDVSYRSYNTLGWPQDIFLNRPGQSYDMSLSFTDNNVVKGSDMGIGGE